MSNEQRKHPRHKVHLEVELGFPSGNVEVVRTLDISEGGVFLVLDKLRRPVLGEVVTVKVINASAVSKDTFPSNDAVVVRQEEGGIGLAFIELDFGDDL